MEESKNEKRKQYVRKDMMFDTGKLPPQAIEFEESVLGILMLELDAINIVLPILEINSFYKDANRCIYEAIVSLHTKGIHSDMVTVTQELKRLGKLEMAGGAYNLSVMTTKSIHGGNLEYQCRIIAQKYIQRQLIMNSSKTINSAYNDETDVFDLLDEAEKGITQLTSKVNTTKIDGIASVYNKWVLVNTEILKNAGGISGIPSGFKGIDELTGGWQKSDLIILAARPGMGKTSMMICLAVNAAVKFQKPIAIFSVEMSKVQLITRMMAQETETNSVRYTRYGLNDTELQDNMEKCTPLINSTLFIDDTPSLSIFELRNKARKLMRDHKIEAIYIDYLQIMKSGVKTNGKTEDVGLVSNALKALAKELEIPVIALSQLSRENEKRGGDRVPSLSDLRNSGEIEQDADVVMFIHRPEYYGILTDEFGNNTEGKAAIIIEKNRSGPVGTSIVTWVPTITKFIDDVNFSQLPMNPLSPHYPHPDSLIDDHPF